MKAEEMFTEDERLSLVFNAPLDTVWPQSVKDFHRREQERRMKESMDFQRAWYDKAARSEIETLRSAGRELLDYLDDEDVSVEDAARLLQKMRNLFE